MGDDGFSGCRVIEGDELLVMSNEGGVQSWME